MKDTIAYDPAHCNTAAHHASLWWEAYLLAVEAVTKLSDNYNLSAFKWKCAGVSNNHFQVVYLKNNVNSVIIPAQGLLFTEQH